jgi:hypothetical protein
VEGGGVLGEGVGAGGSLWERNGCAVRTALRRHSSSDGTELTPGIVLRLAEGFRLRRNPAGGRGLTVIRRASLKASRRDRPSLRANRPAKRSRPSFRLIT